MQSDEAKTVELACTIGAWSANTGVEDKGNVSSKPVELTSEADRQLSETLAHLASIMRDVLDVFRITFHA